MVIKLANKIFIATLTLSFLLLSLQIKAQVVAVSEEMNMLKDVDYDILGKYGDKILMARISEDEVDIQAFDNNLYNSWTRPLKFNAKKLFINTVFPIDNSFNVFYTDIQKDSVYLFLKKFDSEARPVDSILIKSYLRSGSIPKFKVTPSENNKLAAIHHMLPEDQLEVLFFNIEEGILLADHLYDVSEFDFRRDFRTMFLSNLGELFIILDNTLNSGRRIDQMLSVIKSGVNFAIPQVIDFPVVEYMIYNMIYRFDDINQQVVGVGLYTEKSATESIGVVKFTTSTDFSQRPSLNYIPYEPQLIQDFKAGRRSRTEALPNLIIQDAILRVDGGIILLAEERKEYERSLYQGRRDFYSMRFAVDYYYEDLVLIAIHPDGSGHWQKLLQKKQYSFDDDALYSSFFVFKNRSSVRLLYNDEIKNENTVSEYILTGGGKHERRSVLSTNRQDLKLQIRNSLQISSGEVIIPSIKRNKLKLVKVSYEET